MSHDKSVDPDDKATTADTFKRFSHERPDPTTKPPVIQPIQLQPPTESPKPKPKPTNTDSDN